MLASAVASIALFVLGASGIGKLIDPEPTSGALKEASLPSAQPLVWLLALAELIAATMGLISGGIWLLPAIGLYAAFTGFTVWAVRRSSPLQSCGCFGKEDTPPTATHVVFNSLATLGLALSAFSQPPIDWTDGLGQAILILAFGGIGAYLSYLLLAVLPKTMARARL